MAKAKVPSIPDTRTLKLLLEEYQGMLQQVESGVKKVPALNPLKEKFWDELTTLSPLLSMVEARSNGIQEEIVELIDQLPED